MILFKRWTSGPSMCIFSGFIMYLTSCTVIYLMVFVSLERFYILHRPLYMRKAKKHVNFNVISVALLLGLFWSSVPLIGWSHYSIEAGMLTCSVEWKENSLNVYSYNVAMFLFVFILPFGMIAILNIKSIYIVIL